MLLSKHRHSLLLHSCMNNCFHHSSLPAFHPLRTRINIGFARSSRGRSRPLFWATRHASQPDSRSLSLSPRSLISPAAAAHLPSLSLYFHALCRRLAICDHSLFPFPLSLPSRSSSSPPSPPPFQTTPLPTTVFRYQPPTPTHLLAIISYLAPHASLLTEHIDYPIIPITTETTSPAL